MELSRDQIIEFLSDHFKAPQHVKAAFISGSQAFGRHDDLSDIDLRIVADKENFDQIFGDFEAGLNSFVGIAESYNPAFAYFKQRFYKLKSCSPFHMLDVVMLTEEDLPLFLDKQRMGPNPLRLYDEMDLIKVVEMPHDFHEAFKEKVSDLHKQFSFFSRLLVERAIKRNRYAEALHFYNTRIIFPLIEILRYQYSSARQDFGLRYLADDLPESIVTELDDLHRVSSFADLQKNLDQAEKLFKSHCENERLSNSKVL